ncbi:MAG: restriction endonuclease subunit S [Propioniciclava sp.]|uniref:restriction endonuclease subunit S n=1 Tax=Propioniciclava sp. TaxID=2038686 RepID=UPI0039E386E4
MSHITELITELAPHGVPHVALGEVADYSHTRVNASELDETSFVGVDNLVADKGGRIDANYLPNTARLAAYEPGDILIGNIRPYLKKIWFATDAGGCSGDVLAVRVKEDGRRRLDPAFLYYLLSSDRFFSYSMQHAKGAKMPRGSKVAILRYRIPVPPMVIQLQIVEILGKMELLQAELTAELTNRSRQYAYYRDSLLSFRDFPVEWVAVGELGTIFRGKRFTKGDYVADGGVGAVHYGEIYTKYGISATTVVSRVREDLRSVLRYATKGDVILTDVGETVEDVGKAMAWLGEEDVAVHDHCYVIRSKVDASYLAYVMQTGHFLRAKEKHIARTKVKTLLLEGLQRIQVPVPPLEEQLRIVAVLNKFDVLVNDLSSGIPAEIAARRKQYEYYRDKLLTFEEAA